MQKFYDEEPTSDLIENGFTISDNYDFGVSLASLSVKTDKQSEELQKEIGEYVILNSPYFFKEGKKCKDYTKDLFFKTLQNFIGKTKKRILIVGLGNEKVDADSFGTTCVDYLTIKENIFAIKPNVFQNTNIMSFDVVDGICKVIKPDLVILIDSLGTNNIKRLACSFQLSDVGILPGGALSSFNKIISKKTLKIPCVVIGVPFMVFASGLDKSLEGYFRSFILTPKDIEEYISSVAILVSDCLNKIF